MGKVKVIKASAGSGKTFRLAYEYIRSVIREPMHYRHILAVTFTNKATEEMKRRILFELNELASGNSGAYLKMLEADTGLERREIAGRALRARTRILHDYTHFAVLTIDKFFQRIIRSFIRELGIDLNFNLELQTEGLVTRTAETLIDRVGEDEELRNWISEYVEERIDDNRKWDIKTSLTAIGNEIFRENFKRIAAEAPDKATLREVIKTAAAKYHAVSGHIRTTAAEAIGIMDGAGLCVTDFAYGKTGVAGYLAKAAEGRIEEYGTRVAKALLADEGWYAKNSPYKDLITGVIPALREKLRAVCETFDRHRRFFTSYGMLKDNYRSFALLGNLARTMEEICAAEGVMPIAETNNILRKLIAGNDAPFIFEKAGNYYHAFMIDEFQDTSSMQWENFLPLLRNAIAQTEGEAVLLVGDVKQSIYRWRGGDWRILAAEVDHQLAEAEIENLEYNWRSRPEVVRFNNLLLGRIVASADQELTEKLDKARSEGFLSEGKYAVLQGMVAKAYDGHRQVAASDRQGGYATVTYYGLDGEVATPPVVRQIEELQDRGFGAGDIAVLVRYNADGVKIADMLLEHKGRNPGSKYCYDVVTQEALTIGSSPAVNFILACFRLANGDEDIPQKVHYNDLLGRQFGEPVPAHEKEFILSLRRKPLTEAFDAVISYYTITDERHTAYLQALHDQILSWSCSRVGDLPMFVKWWDEAGARQSVNVPGNGKAITIVSIHKSKGLEYKAVIIPYCDWGLTPRRQTLVWARSDGGGFTELGTVPVPYGEKMGGSHFSEGYFTELAMSYVDNINLYYVAATRAEEELHIMVPGIPKNPGRISSLIYGSIPVTGDSAEIGGMKGRVVTEAAGIRIGFGEPVCRPPAIDRPAGAENVLYLPFRFFPVEDRVRQKRSYQRFEEEGIAAAVTPRDYGILLHRVFEKARTRDDVMDGIAALARNGDLASGEAGRLGEIAGRALTNQMVADWFSGRWEKVLSERDIIVPGGSFTRRPDRVMISGDEAVVVDYKFGEIRDSKYALQVSRYMELLRGMGSRQVRGYIWYVTLDEVVEV